MAITQELILDASAAESVIQGIDQQLQQTAELFKVALADALSILGQPIVAPVTADTSEAAAAIGAGRRSAGACSAASRWNASKLSPWRGES